MLCHLGVLDVSSLQNLNHAFIFVVRPKLVLQRGFASFISDTLCSVSGKKSVMFDKKFMFGGLLLVSNKDLEATHNLRERDRSVALPVLNSFGSVHIDHEVFVLALVVDLGLRGISAGHSGY